MTALKDARHSPDRSKVLAWIGRLEDFDESQYLVFPATTPGFLLVGATAMHAQEATADKGFLEALSRFDSAQHDLENGNADTTKAIWSHGDDVTLSGGFGGETEQGWAAIGPRLDWVGSHFSKGTSTLERLAARSSGDLGYVVQNEHIRYQVPGQSSESTRDYRVTMVFRRERGGWRLLHRHADTQMVKNT
ncbi:nuclear transport factor 2 family protein [Paraburkholderia sp. RL17-337-BIB-A]|uniref:nuclear transport factor 2 family protein n=1 Tax=Paraburkholderia sp. RL17-337-BIB-A TaxID=3031636 RepID=UPI0038BCFAC8